MMSIAEQALAHVHIRNLYSRYSHAIDHGRADEFAECFAPDAGFSPNTGPFQEDRGRFTGSESIGRFVTATQENRPRHLMLNVEVTGVGEKTATSRALFALLDVTNGLITGIGQYEDEVVLVESSELHQEWRYAEKRVSFVWQSEKLRARAEQAPKAG